MAFAAPAVPFTVTGADFAVSIPSGRAATRVTESTHRLLTFVSSSALPARSGSDRAPRGAVSASSSPGIRLPRSPPPASRGRPLPEREPKPSPLRSRGSRPRPSFRPRGVAPPRRFPPPAGPERVAARYRTWGSPCFPGPPRSRPERRVGCRPVPRRCVRTLRRLPLVGSRTASLRPLPSCRSSPRPSPDLASLRPDRSGSHGIGRPTTGTDPGISSRDAAGPHPKVRRADAVDARVAPRACVHPSSTVPSRRLPDDPILPCGASAPTALPPGSTTDRVFTPLDHDSRPKPGVWRPTAGPCSTDESVCTVRRCRRPVLVPSMGSVPFRGLESLARWCSRSPGGPIPQPIVRSRAVGCPTVRHAGRPRLSE